MNWFTKSWWAYLFNKKDKDQSWLIVIWCRMRGHPYGVVWYSNSLEPDMTCKNCGDDLA